MPTNREDLINNPNGIIKSIELQSMFPNCTVYKNIIREVDKKHTSLKNNLFVLTKRKKPEETLFLFQILSCFSVCKARTMSEYHRYLCGIQMEGPSRINPTIVWLTNDLALWRILVIADLTLILMNKAGWNWTLKTQSSTQRKASKMAIRIKSETDYYLSDNAYGISDGPPDLGPSSVDGGLPPAGLGWRIARRPLVFLRRRWCVPFRTRGVDVVVFFLLKHRVAPAPKRWTQCFFDRRHGRS